MRSIPAAMANLLVICCLTAMLVPAPAQAQAQNVGHIVQELERLDDAIWMAESTIKNNRYTLQAISAFSAMARGWFTRADSLKQQMQQAQADDDQFMVQSFQAQLDSLQYLDGQVIEVWDGTTVDSLQSLRAKFTDTAEDLAPLVRQSAQAQAELERLKPQRDQYAAQYEQYTQKKDYRAKSLKWEHESLQEDYAYLSEMAGDPNIWLLSGPGSVLVSRPMYVHRGLMMELITQQMLKESMESGQPFDSNALAQRIKNVQAASNAAKAQINQRLNEISQRLLAIEDELDQIDNGKDLAGCWLLNLGKVQATFEIREVAPGIYEGTITSDTLKNYSSGDLAFRVSPAQGKKNTYVGEEFGYDEHGNYRPWPLTIRVYDDSLAYTSDENISMVRCQ